MVRYMSLTGNVFISCVIVPKFLLSIIVLPIDCLQSLSWLQFLYRDWFLLVPHPYYMMFHVLTVKYNRSIIENILANLSQYTINL